MKRLNKSLKVLPNGTIAQLFVAPDEKLTDFKETINSIHSSIPIILTEFSYKLPELRIGTQRIHGRENILNKLKNINNNE